MHLDVKWVIWVFDDQCHQSCEIDVIDVIEGVGKLYKHDFGWK